MAGGIDIYIEIVLLLLAIYSTYAVTTLLMASDF
jgi:hypothetical protein